MLCRWSVPSPVLNADSARTATSVVLFASPNRLVNVAFIVSVSTSVRR
jgi:hypothetical protein